MSARACDHGAMTGEGSPRRPLLARVRERQELRLAAAL